jgi:hypothetical protein
LIDNFKSNGINSKIENHLTDYLSCQIIEKDEEEVFVMKPHLINRLLEKFGDEVKERRVYKTPGKPRFKIIRHDHDSELIDKENNKNSIQELVCYFYLQNMQYLISATSLERYQSAWMEPQWVFTLRC